MAWAESMFSRIPRVWRLLGCSHLVLVHRLLVPQLRLGTLPARSVAVLDVIIPHARPELDALFVANPREGPCLPVGRQRIAEASCLRLGVPAEEGRRRIHVPAVAKGTHENSSEGAAEHQQKPDGEAHKDVSVGHGGTDDAQRGAREAEPAAAVPEVALGAQPAAPASEAALCEATFGTSRSIVTGASRGAVVVVVEELVLADEKLHVHLADDLADAILKSTRRLSTSKSGDTGTRELMPP